MEIKILGTGCPKCKRLEALTREVIDELDVEATLTKVQDIDAIMSYDIASTPGLVIDGKVVASGRIPRKDEIAEWLGAAQAA